MTGMISIPADAALVADFQLNNSFVDAFGRPAIVNDGGSLGATGISFPNNQGSTLRGFSNAAVAAMHRRAPTHAAGLYRAPCCGTGPAVTGETVMLR